MENDLEKEKERIKKEMEEATKKIVSLMKIRTMKAQGKSARNVVSRSFQTTGSNKSRAMSSRKLDLSFNMGQKDNLRLGPTMRSSTVNASKGMGLGLDTDKLNFKLKM